MARSGYTLPVFACASAIAAIQQLRYQTTVDRVTVNLINPAELVEISIEQVAPLNTQSALAITRSDPGDNLDLTRDTPIWAWVTTKPGTQQLIIQGGEGIGKNATNQAAIYRYARELLTHHLEPYLLPNETLEVTIILPAGRALAQRTSNEAFGIVEGLSLLGTSGISQPLSAAEHLQTLQTQLQEQTKHHPLLVFCIGENGLNFAQQLGFPPEILVKTANWLGPLLVTAALGEVQQILLLGYHGKLVKLAGGIFHTHHHLADARLEIFIAQGVKVGIPTEFLQKLLHCETIEAAWQLLQSWDQLDSFSHAWTSSLYQVLAETIDQRTERYLWQQTQKKVMMGSILFGRSRQILVTSQQGDRLLSNLGLTIPSVSF